MYEVWRIVKGTGTPPSTGHRTQDVTRMATALSPPHPTPSPARQKRRSDFALCVSAAFQTVSPLTYRELAYRCLMWCTRGCLALHSESSAILVQRRQCSCSALCPSPMATHYIRIYIYIYKTSGQLDFRWFSRLIVRYFSFNFDVVMGWGNHSVDVLYHLGSP